MEHDEAREVLEIAAVEPGGLDRLMAGDTPEAAAVAGHLAGCERCAAEAERIRRTADLAREVIEAQPDPTLRDRTLAFVRAVGRPREAGPGRSVSDEEVPPLTTPARVATRRASPRARWAVAAAAALIVVSIGVGYAVGTWRTGDAGQARDQQVALLTDAATTAVRIQSQPDARHVALAATADAPGATGSIVFSASGAELVATATNLPPPGDGEEYGCWVEVAGQHVRLGRMYRAGEVWTWAGPADGLDALPPGSTFGVSVGPADGGSDATPVLTGTL
jgi:hypothetical protein